MDRVAKGASWNRERKVTREGAASFTTLRYGERERDLQSSNGEPGGRDSQEKGRPPDGYGQVLPAEAGT